MRRPLAAAALLALTLASCSSNSKVGNRSLLNFKQQSRERLGESSTTTTAGSTAKAGGSAEVAVSPTSAPRAASAPTTARPTTTVAAATVDVAINSDSAATAFDPSALKVAVGSTVVWVNHDSVPRSVRSDDGQTFTSPAIAPGASWSYRATTAGTFNYHDGTRPYAVASLEVAGR